MAARNIALAVVVMLSCIASVSAAASVGRDAIVLTCGASRIVDVPRAPAVAQVRMAQAGLLSLEERGQDLGIDAQGVVELGLPPRLGKFLLEAAPGQTVDVSKVLPGGARASMRASLDCSRSESANRFLAWSARAQAIVARTTASLSTEDYESLKPALDELRNTAPTGYASVLAQHVQAQGLLMAGRAADAADAFHAVREAWLRIGDRQRALAALVAEVEDLQRIGGYQKILTATRSLAGVPDAGSYFGVRLEASRCLALQNIAHLEESARCYEWVLREFERLRETLEHISTEQDYAQLEEDRGHLTHAAELGTRALHDISDQRWNHLPGPDVPIVRGRVERLLGEIAVRRGDVAEGLRHSRRALKYFEDARQPRWRANTLLRIAAIYNQIGAYADAREAVETALGMLSERDAPARVAMAQLTKAEIELSQDQATEAAKLAAQATQRFQELNMGTASSTARLILAEANLSAGRRQEAIEALRAMNDISPSLRRRAELLRAELGMEKSPDEAAPKDVSWEDTRPRPLPEWLRMQRVAAERLLAAGNHDLALTRLEDAARYLGNLAQGTDNAVLQVAIERRKQQLLRVAGPIIASIEKMEMQTEAAWHWVLLMGSKRTIRPGRRVQGDNALRFDEALSQTLFELDPTRDELRRRLDEQTQRELLEVLAAVSTEGRKISGAPRYRSLADFRKSLPRGTTFIAFIPNGGTYLELLATVDRADLRVSVEGQQKIGQLAAAMFQDMSTQRPIELIEQEAIALSKGLLGAFDGIPPPRHLLIFAPEPLNTVPWSFLHWPRAIDALADGTSISLVSPSRGEPNNVDKITLHLLAAGGAMDGRNELVSASDELSAIAEERRLHGWDVRAPVQSSSRDALMHALQDRDSWVHFAGHGNSSAEHLGRSGLLLNGENPVGGAPALVSWVDVVETAVSARAVVLNACALASSPQSSMSASTGFAQATLQAGADDVVAALWPIDDNAASIWASAFYAELPATGPDEAEIAEALRIAMLKLRGTPDYDHPKFWAPYIHLTRLWAVQPSPPRH